MRNAQGGAPGAASNRYGLIPLALAVLPALAVVTTGVNGLVVGAGALASMAVASLLFSMARRFVPARLWGFTYLLFAATAASMAQMIALVVLPKIASSVGLYLPLVALSCSLTGFPDAFDEDHELEDSLIRSLLRGAMYLSVLTLTGCFREVLGAGAIFGISLGEGFQPMRMLNSAPGGLILAGLILALIRAVMPRREKGGEGA
jgi:Na+-translocating ferredoxin:NAD+ oxidoreductase subunit E